MTGWSQLRYAAQSLARTPGLTFILLLTIALGIGSNAVVAGFVRGLVSRDLPLPQSDVLVSIFGRDSEDGYSPVSVETYRALEDSNTFERLGAVRETRGRVILDGRSSVRSIGSTLGHATELLGLPAGGAIISRGLWLSEFGSRSAVGMTIQIDGLDTTIVGVAPQWLEGLHAGSPVDVWIPVEDRTLRSTERTSRTWWALGRIPQGTSAFDAQGAVNMQRSGEEVLAVLPFTGMRPDMAAGFARIRTLLTAAALAVFVIACVNVATFLLSRASGRSRETAVRVALGATRWQLATQLLADSLVLSIVGGAAGALFALWTSGLIPSLFFDQDAEALVFAPGVGAIAVAAAVCVAVMVACGFLPLLEVRDDDPAAVLKRESAGPSRMVQRLRAGLVVTQMACCCVLLVAAGLLLSGFRSALRTGGGQRLGQTILVTLDSRANFDRPDLGLPYFTAALREARQELAVTGGAIIGTPPGTRPVYQSVRFERPVTTMKGVSLEVRMFLPETLDQLEMPPIAGRMFSGADTPGACKVVVVNEAAAEVLSSDPVGQRIIDPSGEAVDVIGVVRMKSRPGRAAQPPTIFYYGEQTGPPRDQTGPGPFQVPARAEAVYGVIDTSVVSPDYFATIGMPVVAGNTFAEADDPRGCRTAVINQEAAELYFGGHAVGGAVVDASGTRTEIVGVVQSLSLRAAQRAPQPAIYLPLSQNFIPRVTLLLPATGADSQLLSSIERRLAAVEGGGKPAGFTTLDAQLARTALAAERIALVLVGASAAIGIALGIFGLYGAMSEAVRRRRREFAVRIALGARARQIIRQVLADGMRLAAAGAAAGLLLGVVVARWLRQIAPDPSPPMWVWIVAPLILTVAVTIASVLPARRAAAVSPLTLMRDE
jgi:putative ABC transport system permease protein